MHPPPRRVGKPPEPIPSTVTVRKLERRPPHLLGLTQVPKGGSHCQHCMPEACKPQDPIVLKVGAARLAILPKVGTAGSNHRVVASRRKSTAVAPTTRLKISEETPAEIDAIGDKYLKPAAFRPPQ